MKLINEVLNEIKRAFLIPPVIVPKHLAKLIQKEDLFIKNGQYAGEHLKEMIKGEIGIFNGKRIVINLPCPKK